MEKIIIYILIFLYVGVFIKMIPLFLRHKENFPYRKRKALFNKSEKDFYLELKKALPDKYEVFPKVRIIDFIEPTTKEYLWKNKIISKHVDFLICDKNFRPILAIELDGFSHKNNKVKIRDIFVNSVYEKVGLPFKRVRVGENYLEKSMEISTSLNSPF